MVESKSFSFRCYLFWSEFGHVFYCNIFSCYQEIFYDLFLLIIAVFKQFDYYSFPQFDIFIFQMQTFSNNKLKLTYTYFYGASYFNLLKSLFYLNLMGHFIKIELLSGTERIITLCVKILI